MDATQRGLWFHLIMVSGTFSALVFMNLACGAQSGTINSADLNGADCVNQAKQDSFLVKWIETVPPEYASNKIGPKSLITRFSNTNKSTVEQSVLKQHINDYAMAEYEFNLYATQSAPSPSGTAAWGPQDIDVADAWNVLGEKGEGVIVAVVDSGIDLNQPLLESQIWINHGEIPNNGIDDDRDGYVDDYNGYNFNANSSDVTDGLGHGTHVSGVIAGQAGINGFTGIAPNATIMPLKFMDNTGNGAVGDAITAIDYASAHGAKVINASWGGAQCSSLLQQEMVTVTSSGTVFSNAAGNNSSDLAVAPDWPAAYQMPGKITVASYNTANVLSSFSNFGVLVDLAAPGENILSTYPPAAGQAEGQMAVMSGTSMATPFVAGVAALLMGARPSSSASDIADAINASVTAEGFNVRTTGKLNAYQAAQYLLSH